jgi:hypothetical protein
MAVFWVAVPWSLVEVYRCFRGTCYLHHQCDEAASTSETSVEDSHLHTRRRENLKSHFEGNYEILGFHGGEDDDVLLGFGAV